MSYSTPSIIRTSCMGFLIEFPSLDDDTSIWLAVYSEWTALWDAIGGANDDGDFLSDTGFNPGWTNGGSRYFESTLSEQFPVLYRYQNTNDNTATEYSGTLSVPAPETLGTPYWNIDQYGRFLKFPPKFNVGDTASLTLDIQNLNAGIVGHWQIVKKSIDGSSYVVANHSSPNGWVVNIASGGETATVEIPEDGDRGGVFTLDGTVSTAHGHDHKVYFVFEIPCMTATITATPLP